jgi:hypothetical protein
MTSSLRPLLVTLAALALGVAGCGSSPSGTPSVPTVAGAAAASSGTSRSSAVDAAVACIREHGIPGYQDPAIAPGGAVYTDVRSFENASESARNAVRSACGALMATARLDSEHQPPAPPAFVRAGVKVAQCARAHGLPNMHDPNAASNYVPGHGFTVNEGEMPGGKSSPGFATFRQACKTEIDAMMKASTLASLGGRG